ncbi:hypothetical protein Y88_3022 [Novosphingobium nitrogenifigens DSM 19370]|uniref:Uncharacterized protein n=1 Tax=Novosphingobium nitrogenifigens DSM 19370 TaxID=983920 RepID=F1ZC98_9SPHN|nr:hypothetical protein Y88_3022 [Novosphingobium nitrogenifigens DSM 19370]
MPEAVILTRNDRPRKPLTSPKKAAACTDPAPGISRSAG